MRTLIAISLLCYYEKAICLDGHIAFFEEEHFKLKAKKWIKRVALFFWALIILSIVIIVSVYAYGKHQLREKAAVIVAEKADAVANLGDEYLWRDDVFNIVCIGVDREEDMMWQYEDGRSLGQADAIFVLSIDLKSNEIRIISIPRDTMVELRMYNSAYGYYIGKTEGQIALQYAYADGGWKSCSQVEHRVSEILGGAPMDGYVAINLSCISSINDAVGGVEVTMDEDYTWINPEFAQGATVRLQGRESRDYIQRRDTDVYGSALTRISRQKQYLKAFIYQAKFALLEDIHLPLELMDELSNYMVTSFSEEEITYLAMEALTCSYSDENMYVLPGEIKMGEVYEEYYFDEDAVKELAITLFCKEKAN